MSISNGDNHYTTGTSIIITKVEIVACDRESDIQVIATICTTLRELYSKPCYFYRKLIQCRLLMLRDHLVPLRANAQTTQLVYSTDCSHQLTTGVEKFRHNIFFLTPTHVSHAIHLSLPLSLAYFKTQVHILFFFKSTLRSKVNM